MVDERSMGRRHVLRGAGLAVATAAVTGLGVASPAMASDEGDGALSGSWLVTRQDTGSSQQVRLILSLAAGAVIISHDIAPEGPVFTGTWARRGEHGFRATFWAGLAGTGRHPVDVLVRVQIRDGVLHDGVISGHYEVTVYEAKNNRVVQRGTGSFHGRRIEA